MMFDRGMRALYVRPLTEEEYEEVNRGLKNICRKNASKMDTDFALDATTVNFTNCPLERGVVPGVNIAFMISPAVGSITAVSVVFSGFH